ncbi:MAG: FUSC family protein [Luteolibacter sp.]
MVASKRWSFLSEFFERESLRPDLNRAVRATTAFMVPLVAVAAGWVKFEAIHLCIAAQSIAMVDVRGPYSLRLGLLLAVGVIFCASTYLGGLGAESLAWGLVATALLIAAGGCWRHLSPDYGPGLAVASGLLFFVTLAETGPGKDQATLATAIGSGFGLLLQVLLWPFHPQHPLRRTAAESWSALGDLLAAMAGNFTSPGHEAELAEVELRATLNRTQASLNARKRRLGGFHRQVELLNIAAARLGMRVIALRTALESNAAKPEFRQFELALLPVVHSLTNSARSVALAVVSRQPSHWAAFEVRVKRLENLFDVAKSQAALQISDPVARAQVVNLLQQVQDQLPIVRVALKNTLSRSSERGAFSLELFDLETLTLRPLAATLNFSRSIDPVLVRHTARAMVLTLVSVAWIKWMPMSHGYWLPLTILVVLQPDFGATREKAAQRVLGTLIGGAIASSLLWLHPPLVVVLIAAGTTMALFGYFLKRNYGLAVVFITLMVVLLTEAHQPVTLAFTLERMGLTLTGGLLAFGAAWIFWPSWEKRRFPAIMAKALGCNLEFLKRIDQHLSQGIPYTDEIVQVMRSAESANAEAFSSLRRMSGDPENHRQGLEKAAALANGNKRVTQALSVIALHLNPQRTHHPEALEHFEKICVAAFEDLIELAETGGKSRSLSNVLSELETFRTPEIDAEHADPHRFREPWIFPQLVRVCTELSGMIRVGVS